MAMRERRKHASDSVRSVGTLPLLPDVPAAPPAPAPGTGSAPATPAPAPSAPSVPAAPVPAPSDAPAAAPSGSDLDRAIALSELRRLICAIADFEPGYWTEADIAEAIAEGERDLEAALQTWRALCERLGLEMPEVAGSRARRKRVLAMFAARPGIRYALDGIEPDPRHPDCVVLGLGIRRSDGTIWTCDLLVPRDRFDPFALLELVERHGGALD
jgi:hypothetical protein